jgi:hypothetical protein
MQIATEGGEECPLTTLSLLIFLPKGRRAIDRVTVPPSLHR